MATTRNTRTTKRGAEVADDATTAQYRAEREATLAILATVPEPAGLTPGDIEIGPDDYNVVNENGEVESVRLPSLAEPTPVEEVTPEVTEPEVPQYTPRQWNAIVRAVGKSLTAEHNSRWAVGDVLVTRLTAGGRPPLQGVSNGRNEVLVRLANDLHTSGQRHVAGFDTLRDAYRTALAFPARERETHTVTLNDGTTEERERWVGPSRDAASFSVYREFAARSNPVEEMTGFLLDAALEGNPLTVKTARAFLKAGGASAAVERRERAEAAAARLAAIQAEWDAETPEQRAERERAAERERERQNAQAEADARAQQERIAATTANRQTNAQRAAGRTGTTSQTSTQNAAQAAPGASTGTSGTQDLMRSLDIAIANLQDAAYTYSDIRGQETTREEMDAIQNRVQTAADMLNLLLNPERLSDAAIQTAARRVA